VFARRILGRARAVGVAAYASVPGAYAWGVTVAPIAWERGASAVSKVAAVASLVSLIVGPVGERRWGSGVRFASLWAFTTAAALAWCASPLLLRSRFDGPHGSAGVIGWALFAFAVAVPPRGVRDVPARGVSAVAGSPRPPLRGDAAYLIAGGAIALAAQVIGWRVASVERALLARFVALAVGLGVIEGAAQLGCARYGARVRGRRASRLRRALGPLVLLGILALGIALLALRR